MQGDWPCPTRSARRESGWSRDVCNHQVPCKRSTTWSPSASISVRQLVGKAVDVPRQCRPFRQCGRRWSSPDSVATSGAPRLQHVANTDGWRGMPHQARANQPVHQFVGDSELRSRQGCGCARCEAATWVMVVMARWS